MSRDLAWWDARLAAAQAGRVAFLSATDRTMQLRLLHGCPKVIDLVEEALRTVTPPEAYPEEERGGVYEGRIAEMRAKLAAERRPVPTGRCTCEDCDP